MLKKSTQKGKNQLKWLFLLIFWCIFANPAQAAVQLRIAIKRNIDQLQLGSSTSAVIRNESGRKVGEIAPLNSIKAYSQNGKIGFNQSQSNQIWIEPQQGGYVWIDDRWYRGKVRVVPQGNTFTAINYVNLEDYLYSVVGAEAIPSWPADALKAQAVAARSYALYKKSTTKNNLYDLDTTTRTQVYKGLNSEYTTTHDAVNSTLGQVMTYGGKPILAVFHSASGGHTENVEDIWTSPLPYLRGVKDFDRYSPVYNWQKVVYNQEFSNLIGGVGRLRAINPEKRTPRGRVVRMRVIGDRGTKTLTGDQLRKILDLRSTLFNIDFNGNNLEINGKGFGHGVGLSQWGSHYLAQTGTNYRQILSHYYQRVKISNFKTR